MVRAAVANRKVEAIHNISATTRVYDGSSRNGQLAFSKLSTTADPGMGWYHFNRLTCQYGRQGAAITLAMGITECCADYGRGKMYFLETGNEGIGDTRTAPEESLQLPQLLYVDYCWTDVEKDEWFNLPHTLRYQALNARAYALALKDYCMPISLTYDRKKLLHPKFYDSWAPVTLMYHQNGWTHLGFAPDLANIMYWTPRSGTTRGYWVKERNNIAQFNIASGMVLASELHNLYSSGREGSLYRFSSVMEKVYAAHDNWVANGGYTIASDSDLGQKVQDGIDQQLRDLAQTQPATVPDATVVSVQALASAPIPNRPAVNPLQDLLMRPAAATIARAPAQLQILRTHIESWSIEDQQIAQAVCDHAFQGTADIMRFMTFDAGWMSMGNEKKESCIRHWELTRDVEGAPDDVYVDNGA